MGFTNKTCADSGTKDLNKNPGPVLREPVQTGRRLWERWVLEDMKTGSDGSYLATIRTRRPKDPIINCIGNLEPGKFNACKAKLLYAHQVTLRQYSAASPPQLWRIVPLPENPRIYNIILNSRRNGCLRFLGASPSCAVDELSLFKGDDGSGLQQWTITPAFTPPKNLPPPSPPPVVRNLKPPPPPSPPKAEVPKVSFTFAFPGIDIDNFGAKDEATICESLMQVTNYNRSLLYCDLDKVETASTANFGDRRWKLRSYYLPKATEGIVTSGGMTFNVNSTSQTNQALVAAQEFNNYLQDENLLNQTLGPEVTGSPVVLLQSSTEATTPTPPSPSTPTSR